jgi:D-lactate dehydrogenase
MKISVFEAEPWEQESFEALKGDHEIRFAEEALDKENGKEHEDADVISTFIYSNLGVDVLEAFKNLRLISTRSTGFDHIELEYCASRDITVCNVPTYGENTVAEHVFALLLTISHNLTEAIDRTRKGDFSQKGLRGFDLMGKRIGVIGTGSIGQCVVKIAKGFQMDVVAFDVNPSQDASDHLGFSYVGLDELLETSDVVTLHVPGSAATRHLLSSSQFDQMKRGVVLINTSRGSVVDVKALIRALEDGTVSAAGLDVLPEEPVIREEAELLHSVFQERHELSTLLADHVLMRLRNVFVTPHSGFNTKEAVRRILQTTVENITAFARGTPQNVISGKG